MFCAELPLSVLLIIYDFFLFHDLVSMDLQLVLVVTIAIENSEISMT